MEARFKPIVLICPLNWGLGHASRCIPIINGLLSRNCKVVVAADGPPLALLQKEFPHLVFFRFRGKTVRYPEKGNMVLKMLAQVPSLLYSIWKEHKELKKLIIKTGASVVISDNRYGLWSKHAKTVFITHQLFIRAPRAIKWVEPVIERLNKFFIRRFDQCWVPDFPESPGLSGSLSHKESIPGVRFVGTLSRISDLSESGFKNPLPNDFNKAFSLAIISGPEPQRSIFENILRAQVEKTTQPVVFMLGKPEGGLRQKTANAYFFDHATTAEFAWLIKNAGMVICRSGYSTLMDLSAFGKKALLVPTPGQTEQEYLGQMLAESGQARCVKQMELKLESDIILADKCYGIKTFKQTDDLLNEALAQVLNDL
jgi:UDP:flavonoid glycosyltransferase YjiC (YdhE family)